MANKTKWALFHTPKSDIVFIDDRKEFIEDVLKDNDISLFPNGTYYYKSKKTKTTAHFAAVEHAVLLNEAEFEIVKIQVLTSTEDVFTYKVIKDA